VPKERDNSAGVSYRDVEVAMRAVQSEFNCNVTYELSLPVVDGTSVLFWVKVEAAPRWVGKKTVRAVIARQRRWPHVDHQTMAGLLFWLVNELHAALDEQGLVPVQAALFD